MEALNKAILAFSAHGEQKAWFLLAFIFNRLRGRKWRHIHVPRETPIKSAFPYRLFLWPLRQEFSARISDYDFLMQDPIEYVRDAPHFQQAFSIHQRCAASISCGAKRVVDRLAGDGWEQTQHAHRPLSGKPMLESCRVARGAGVA